MFSLPHINQSHFFVGASAKQQRIVRNGLVLCVCFRVWSLPVIDTKWEGDGVGDVFLPQFI